MINLGTGKHIRIRLWELAAAAEAIGRSRAMAVVPTAILLAYFVVLIGPAVISNVQVLAAGVPFHEAIGSGQIPGALPDSADYAYGAEALLHSRYVVSWEGKEHVPRYTPGMSILLMPAVALGGMTGALWVCFGAALLLGVLVAYVAHRLVGPLAAPLAVCAILFTPLIGNAAQIVMSDLPSTVVAVLELALLSGGCAELLAIGELDIWIVAAGALGGVLVWLRSASLVFLVAGLVSLTARDRCRRRALCYVAGALPLLLLLGAWQARVTGSPFQTGYQLLGTTGEMDDSGALFSPHYAVRPPFASAQDGWSVGGQGMSWSLPNAVIYPLQLFGADGFLLRPGVGFLGLIGLLRYARRRGAPGVIGRGGLVFIVLTLAVYLQYYYQSGRFLMPAATFLGLGAAALVAEVSYNILRMVAVTGAAGPSLRVSDGLARWLRVRKGRSDPTDALSGDDIWSERVGR